MNLLHHDFAAFYGSGSVRGSHERVTVEIPGYPDDTRYVLTLNPLHLPDQPQGLKITGRIVIPKRCKITARGTTPGGMPPNFRPILLRNWTDEHARWWHGDCAVIERGEFSLRADLQDLSRWSSVFGKSADGSEEATHAFRRGLAKPLRIGLTFGGRDHFGHGVFATRPGARVIIDRFIAI